jgi:hypothetical protein
VKWRDQIYNTLNARHFFFYPQSRQYDVHLLTSIAALKTKDGDLYVGKVSTLSRVHHPSPLPLNKSGVAGLLLISKWKSMPHETTSKMKTEVPWALREGSIHERYENGTMTPAMRQAR